jgi:hypothetical protein
LHAFRITSVCGCVGFAEVNVTAAEGKEDETKPEQSGADAKHPEGDDGDASGSDEDDQVGVFPVAELVTLLVSCLCAACCRFFAGGGTVDDGVRGSHVAQTLRLRCQVKLTVP